MKKLACAIAVAGLGTPAFAADMAVKAPPPVAPAPVFSWTGWYIGATAGYGSAHGDGTLNVGDALFPVGFSSSSTFNGGLFGVEAGANYQFNWVVVGIEGDWQGSAISGTNVLHSPLHPGVVRDAYRDIDGISTITGRLGIAWDRWLLYGKGGGAWLRVDENGSSQTLTAGGVVLDSRISTPTTLSGYVVGGGLEWAPWDQISFKVEGDWYNFGTNSSLPATCVGGILCTIGTQTPGGGSTSKDTAWEIKAGFNIRFNGLALAGAH